MTLDQRSRSQGQLKMEKMEHWSECQTLANISETIAITELSNISFTLRKKTEVKILHSF